MPATLSRKGFCVFALALTSLHAEEKPLGPQDLVNGLMQNNPEILAAHLRFEAATKRPSQVGTLPEPTARYTNFGVGHPFSRLNSNEFAYQGFGIAQQIPFPGKLGLASEEAKREVEGEQHVADRRHPCDQERGAAQFGKQQIRRRRPFIREGGAQEQPAALEHLLGVGGQVAPPVAPAEKLPVHTHDALGALSGDHGHRAVGGLRQLGRPALECPYRPFAALEAVEHGRQLNAIIGHGSSHRTGKFGMRETAGAAA